ncbi:MAG: hypothetical protein H8K06_11020 [Nitrospira sp.]|nr:hypothetical protein [Nitrospira sp.]
MHEIPIGQPVGIELVLGIDRDARGKGAARETHRETERTGAGEAEWRIDEPERMPMVHIPRELHTPLRVRAVALNVGQAESGSGAAVGNLYLIARLPYGACFKFQGEAMVAGRHAFG